MAFRKLGTAVAFVACGLVLVGCTPGPTISTPTATVAPTTGSATPTPSDSPTLSDDQAAAVSKVEEYFATLNGVLVDKRSPGDLATVARNAALADSQRGYNQIKMAGYRVTGSITISKLVPSEATKPGSRPQIAVTFCQDTTGRQISDKSGKPVVTGKVTSTLATVEQWPTAWFVTSFKDASGTC